ncbi:MAG TPA: ABC transporter substrate-binding protein [Stellaceae bacterium]|nr:ABC transporter substrate-binding protein [Stellaceae bacterium]
MRDKLRYPWLRYPWVVAAALVLSLASLAGAPRGASAQDASNFIQNLGTQGIQVLGPSVPAAQRTARFRQLLDADFDMQSISRFVMGPQGRGMSPEQQQEFTTLFRDYVAQTYSDKLGTYGGSPFRVTGTRPNGEETLVTSQVQRQNGNPVEMVWHVANRGGRFLVTDVQVDGASMKVSQRDQIAAIVQRNGGRPDALLSVMRQQVAQTHRENAGPRGMPQGGVGSSMPPRER